MTVAEVLPTVAKAFQGALDIFFRVFDGLQATDYVFGALVVATIFRLLLVPLIGGRTPNEIKLSSSADNVDTKPDLKKEKQAKKESAKNG